MRFGTQDQNVIHLNPDTDGYKIGKEMRTLYIREYSGKTRFHLIRFQ